MSALLPYAYVVLRVVPVADREEFVNVGIVLRCQEADYLGAGFHVDTARLAALAPDLDLVEVEQALRVVCEVADGVEGGGRPRLGSDVRRFGWLSAPRSTVVRPGPVHTGLAADPAAELDRLLIRLVR